jgi:hypothetical protein
VLLAGRLKQARRTHVEAWAGRDADARREDKEVLSRNLTLDNLPDFHSNGSVFDTSHQEIDRLRGCSAICQALGRVSSDDRSVAGFVSR